jgi:hypothetical protein
LIRASFGLSLLSATKLLSTRHDKLKFVGDRIASPKTISRARRFSLNRDGVLTPKFIVGRARYRLRKTDPIAEVSGEHSSYVAHDFFSRNSASALQQSLVRVIQRLSDDDA